MSEKDLIEAVRNKSKEIKVSSISYSARELRSMFDEGSIDIHPEFQRIFRWTLTQKSSLIESMLLSIPLPSIFVAADDDDSWEVVDGVQRLSTIFSFMGLDLTKNSSYSDGEINNVNKADDDNVDDELEQIVTDYGNENQAFKLGNMVHLTELSGMGWADMPLKLRRKIENTRIDVTIIDSDSSADAKYNLFMRLNSGSILSQQELRNGMLVMIDNEFFRQMKKCSIYENFKTITQVSEKKRSEAFQDELVLRFFMQLDFTPTDRKSLANDFGEELTEWAKQAAIGYSSSDKRKLDYKLFCRVVDLLLECGGEDVFRRYNPTVNKRQGPVSNAAFEFVMSGVAPHIDFWEKHKSELSQKLVEYWQVQSFSENRGQGINARDRFPVLVENGRTYFNPVS